MKAREFVSQLRHADIVEAIRSAEKQTSGEIRVFVTRKPIEEPVKAAQEQFLRLGMEKTRERNGVLILVAPRVNKFAVIGDKGIHERCGQEFWERMVTEMGKHFRDAHYTQAIIHAVTTAGTQLATHFPRQNDDRNELPDEVTGD